MNRAGIARLSKCARSHAIGSSACGALRRLRADGFTDLQILRWAETYIAENSSGTADEFVEWIAAQEKRG